MLSSTPSITIDAGYHDRAQCPLVFTLSEALPQGNYSLRAKDGADLPLQALSSTTYAYVEPLLAKGEKREYQIVAVDAPQANRVVIEPDTENALKIERDGELITRYVFGGVKARPYFYPVLAPEGVPVTRAYPMVPDSPNEERDHPHHRSIWIAHGEVNDTDNWSEEKGHGHTEHRAFDFVESGAACGRFQAQSVWTSAQHKPILDESLMVTVWNTNAPIRLLDYEIRLTANYGDVHCGDTKEGGILSVRVASALDVPRTGTITNSYNGINEGDTWGKAAHWCDYSGVVQGREVGIAVCDHPHSFRYPTHWHVRNYGLMTANPFGYSYYTNGVKNGAHDLKSGETLLFRYRMILHTGDVTTAKVNDHYLNFAAPPVVKNH